MAQRELRKEQKLKSGKLIADIGRRELKENTQSGKTDR